MSTADNLLAWQNAIKASAAAATSIPWYWENEKSGSRPDQHGILSGPDGVEAIGQDWVEYETSSPGMAVPLVKGYRVMQIGARVVSRTQTAGKKAWVYLERFRMALRRPQLHDTWNAIGMSLAYRSGIRLSDAKGSNDRMHSIASMTLTLNILPDTLTGGEDLGTIEHVQVSSTGLNPDVEDVIIPE